MCNSTPVQGVLDTKEDRARDKARAELADAYDDFDMRVEQHWTEKVRLPANLQTQIARLKPGACGLCRWDTGASRLRCCRPVSASCTGKYRQAF